MIHQKKKMGLNSRDELSDAQGSDAPEERILVSVRLRPLNDKEIAQNDVANWECINNTTILFKNNNLPDRSVVPVAYSFGKETAHIYIYIFLFSISET